MPVTNGGIFFFFRRGAGARYARQWRAKGDDSHKVKAVKGLCKTWGLGKSFNNYICIAYHVAVYFFLLGINIQVP